MDKPTTEGSRGELPPLLGAVSRHSRLSHRPAAGHPHVSPTHYDPGRTGPQHRITPIQVTAQLQLVTLL